MRFQREFFTIFVGVVDVLKSEGSVTYFLYFSFCFSYLNPIFVLHSSELKGTLPDNGIIVIDLVIVQHCNIELSL